MKLSKQDWTGSQEIADTLRKLDGEGDKSAADQIVAAALGGQQKYDEAATVLQDALASTGNNGSSMTSLVQTYLRAGERDKAEQFLKSVLDTNPNNVQALILMASVEAIDNRLDEAEATLKKAAAADPDGVVANRALAEFYARANRLDDAEASAREAASHQKPGDTSAQLLLAMILERAGKYDAAIAEYQTLFAADPRSAVLANNLANLLAEHGGTKESLDKAYEIASRFQQTEIPQYKDTLGWIYYLRGEYPNAVTLLKSAAEKLPKVEAVQYHLGMAYKALGEKKLAMGSLTSALALARKQGSSESSDRANAALNELESAGDVAKD